jgi:hypothetical protein
VTRRWRRNALAALVAPLLAVAAAHATLVLGELTVVPDPPRPNVPFEVAITLVDPSLAPVEQAVVAIELRRHDPATEPLPAASTEAPELDVPKLALSLREVAPARYVGELTLPEGGLFHLLVRDTTFQWEEANASLLLEVGGAPVGTLPFILPPTAIGPRSLWTWLLWLVGLPVLAGIVVTILVLTSKPGAAAKPAGTPVPMPSTPPSTPHDPPPER